jgi:ADP-ribose pyrophosphatase
VVLNGKRERYEQIASERPYLFSNPPGASFEILFNPELVAAAEGDEEERLTAKGRPAAWSQTGVVYEDPYTMILRDAVRCPDGTLGTYSRSTPTRGSAGSVVLPLLDGSIVLLRQFRHATRRWHLEIPRGFGEVGVSPEDQASRELLEEIGARASELISLGPFNSNTGAATDQAELFLAVISDVGRPQTSEGIEEIRIFPPEQVARLIAGTGTGGQTELITDSFTIGAFTRAWLRNLLPGLNGLAT